MLIQFFFSRMTEECIPFEESAKIYKEFIEVTCTLFNKTIYQDYHAFIVPKKSSSDFNRKPDVSTFSVKSIYIFYT